MLDQYRKPGGFLQLLNLIETCGPKKQEKFLEMIETEDHRWSEAIRRKMLTVEKIFSWDEQTLSDVVAQLQELNLSVALYGLAEDVVVKVKKHLPHLFQRKLQDLKEIQNPNVSEISSALMKIISEVRSMINRGTLHLERVAPELAVESDIEEILSKQPLKIATDLELAALSDELKNDIQSQGALSEFEILKKRYLRVKADLAGAENENKSLKEKLQIINKLSSGY